MVFNCLNDVHTGCLGLSWLVLFLEETCHEQVELFLESLRASSRHRTFRCLDNLSRLARHDRIRVPKPYWDHKDLVFARGEFLSVVGSQNESLRIILMYYMFKYWFGITTTLLESLRSQNTQFKDRFRQTSYKDLVFARGEFLSVVGAQNESLRLIIICYIKLHIWDLNNFARFTSKPKNKSKGSI